VGGSVGRLHGRAALITGGTTGLGFAIAERFMAEGARVVVTGRDEALGAAAEANLRAAAGEDGVRRASFVRADQAVETDVAASVAVALDRLGGLDILVNNAGIGVSAGLLQTPVEDFDRLMAVNLRGPFLYARACYPCLRDRRGCMIHIASDAGVTGEPDIGAYSVSKAAVIMLSKMLAMECGPDGVRSNSICPGDIAPGMRHFAAPGQADVRAEDPSGWRVPPIGRIGRAGDVADAAVFLASDEASFCTGSVLLVDGGMRAGHPPACEEPAPGAPRVH
jgi:NAD(P)-dependent dehydrogenase (short-subunit alcohol dehydrogenase family)